MVVVPKTSEKLFSFHLGQGLEQDQVDSAAGQTTQLAYERVC